MTEAREFPAQTLRRLGPTAHESLLPCPACHRPFKVGEYTTVLALGPGDDPEARERARQGRAYNAAAIEIHWACATGDEG